MSNEGSNRWERKKQKRDARRRKTSTTTTKRVNHKTPGSSKTKKPEQKTVPVTEETKERLRQWTSSVGEVGATNATTTRKSQGPKLITAVFSLMNYKKGHPSDLITYNATREEVYGIIPNNKGFIPQAGIRYLCEEPRPKQERLFVLNNRSVYTVNVYPLIVKQVNEGVISLTLEDPEFVMTENILSQSTFGRNDVVFCVGDEKIKYIWVENEKKRMFVLNSLNQAERAVQGVQNSWTCKHGRMLKSPKYSMLGKDKISEIVLNAFDKPLSQPMEEIGTVVQNNNEPQAVAMGVT